MVKILFYIREISLFFIVQFLVKLLKRFTVLNYRQNKRINKGNTYWSPFFFEAFLMDKLTFLHL
jgi:hypothetical protein